MFSRIVLGHNHKRSTSTGNDSVAYISLLRHIRKSVLIRWIIASHSSTAVGCQLFRKE